MALAPTSATIASFHTHRLAARSKILSKIFSLSAMERAWKDYVRPGLRSQELADLHDYNDFHWGRNERFETLHAEIVSGRYRPTRSMPVRIEKRNGVTRTIVIPSPEDALVLQCIVEHVLPLAIAKQPSKNAFFSRSHGFSNPEFKFEKDYIWFKRWAQFSKLRFEITSTHSCVLTTDIANYFDNIDYTHLRNMMSSLGGIDEVTMDVLFSVLDTISWRPDYLPSPGRSLPQVDFDAPRLLSHIYLFEADEFLNKRCGGAFVRWVDDMTAATGSHTDAKNTLRDLDQLLMTRGLRLNSGKTQILSPAQAQKFFQAVENRHIDSETARLGKITSAHRLQQWQVRARKNFDRFIALPPYGHSDKVVKRYLSLFTRVKDDHAVGFCSEKLISQPDIRDSIWRYFTALGPTPRVFKALKDYVLSDHALDDASLAHVARLLTTWEVIPNSKMHKSLKALGVVLGETARTQRSAFFLIASISILAKYGLQKDLYDVLKLNQPIWTTSDFLSRQVAGTLPKFRKSASGKEIRREIERHKLPAANSVLLSLQQILSRAPILLPAVRGYVVNGNNPTPYSIERFLLCLHVLTCTDIPPGTRRSVRLDVLKILRDPIYRRVLMSISI